MKVVIVSDYSLNSPYGGLQTHVYHLAKAISKNSVETHIITFSDRNEDIKSNNLNIHFIKRSSRLPMLFTIPFDAKNVINKIKEIDPDVVHVQGTHYPYNYISRAIPEKYPVIITVHGIMATEYKFNKGLNFIGGFISYLLEKYAFRKAKNIIVCSEVMKKEIGKLSRAKVYVVPNGVDCKKIDNFSSSKVVIHPSIIYIGLLEKIKGVDTLIKAINIIKDDIPEIHFYIAGKGSQEENLRKLTKKLGLENNIDFLGYISGEEKYSNFKSVDICAVPSRYESFGITILEAMACGKPVIASNVGNIPSLVDENTGILFESENEKDIAQKIINLLKNQDLRDKMGLNAEKRAKEFDWDKISEKTVNIYKKII
ncbi:MAG: glycosyltransferase family 4 protein [Methanobacterium sp.]|uniref:glycosyltransferase family 4 protein n=1 Tax=Methanobacterium sp. TaxID=2164 RepID=UPI003D65AD8D|nr:glycosyltransferase family 4 protein [Methanobacterium sp.]